MKDYTRVLRRVWERTLHNILGAVLVVSMISGVLNVTGITTKAAGFDDLSVTEAVSPLAEFDSSINPVLRPAAVDRSKGLVKSCLLVSCKTKFVGTVSKTVKDANGNGYGEPGEKLTYTITIKNLSVNNVTGVSIADSIGSLSAYFEEDLNTVYAKFSTGGSASLAALAKGTTFDIAKCQTITITYTVTVKSTICNGSCKTISNKVTVGGYSACATIAIKGGTPNFTTSTKKVTDASGDGYASPGEVLNYQLIIRNSSVYAGNAAVYDKMDGVLPYIVENKANVQVTISDANGTRYVKLSDLISGFNVAVGANGTATVSFSVTLLPTLNTASVTRIRNAAIIGGFQFCAEIPTRNLGQNENFAKSVSDASGNGKAEPGEAITYTFTLPNSTSSATYVLVSDPFTAVRPYIKESLDSVTYYVNGVAKGTGKDLKAGVYIPVAANSTAYLTITVTVKDTLDTNVVTSLKNTGYINGYGYCAEIPTGALKKNTLSGFNKTVSDENGNLIAEPGEEITYEIYVANKNDEDVHVKITDDLSGMGNSIAENLSDVVVTGSNGNTYTLAQLKSGISGLVVPANGALTLTYTITIRDDFAPATLKRLVNIVYFYNEDVKVTDAIQCCINTGIITDLKDVTKTVSDADGSGKAQPGEVITFVITARNAGVSSATFNIKDTLSAVKPYLDPATSYTDTSVVTVTYSSGGSIVNTETKSLNQLIAGFNVTLPSGQTIKVSVPVKVRSDLNTAAVTQLTNAAIVAGNQYCASIPTESKGTLTDPMKAVSDANGNGIAEPGEVLTYTLSARNFNSAAISLKVTDDLAGITPYIKEDPATVYLTIDNVLSTKKLSDLQSGITTSLANGTYVITFRVTLKDDLNVEEVTKIVNTAHYTNLDDDADSTRQAEIPTGTSKVATVDKSVTDNGDGLARPGDVLSYKIEVTNPHGSSMKATVQDSLSGVLPYITQTAANIDVAVTIGSSVSNLKASDLVNGTTITIPAGQKATFAFSVTLKDSFDYTAISSIKNTVKVYDHNAKQNITDTAEISTIDDASALRVDKTVSDASGDGYASPGEVLNYSIAIRNTSDAAIKSFVSDKLDGLLPNIKESASAITVSGNGTTYTGSQLVSGITINIPANSTITLTFSVTVKDSLNVTSVTSLDNRVSVYDYSSRSYVNDDASIPTRDNGADELSSSKVVRDQTGNNIASPGEFLTYWIVAENNTSHTKKVLIKDTLSNILPNINESAAQIKVTVYDVQTGGTTSYTGSQLVAGFTYDIPADHDIHVVFSVTLKDSLDVASVTSISNTATIYDYDTSITDTVTTTIPTGDGDVPQGDLDVDKTGVDASGDGYAQQGERITYTITIRNNESTSMSATVSDTLSGVLPYIKEAQASIAIDVNNGGTHYSYTGTQLVNGNVVLLLAGNSTATLTYSVTIKDDLNYSTVTSIDNTVIVRTPHNEFEDEEEIPTGNPDKDITILKTVTDASGDGIAQPGETLHYKLTIVNNESSSQTIKVQDNMLELISYIEDTDFINVIIKKGTTELTDLATNGTRLRTGFNLTLDANSTYTISYDVYVLSTLNTGTVTQLHNIAVIYDTSDNAIDSSDVTIPTGGSGGEGPNITIAKSVSDASGDNKAQPGEVLSYTLTIINGETTSQTVKVQDNLLELLDHVNESASSLTVTIKKGSTTVATKTGTDLVNGFSLALDASSTYTVNFSLTVKSSLDTASVTQLHNIAVIYDSDDDAIDSDDVTIPTDDGNDGLNISLTKAVADASGNNIAAPGEVLNYTLTIVNGESTAYTVWVQDNLVDLLDNIDESPSAISVTVKKGSSTVATRTGTQLISGFSIALDANSTYTVSYSVTVKSSLDTAVVTRLHNTAIIYMADDDNLDEAEATIPTGGSGGEGPDISDSYKSVSDADGNFKASPGEVLTYSIYVVNKGGAGSVTVKDQMTGVLPYIKESASSVSVKINGADSSLHLSDLIAGYTTSIGANTTIRFSFSVTLKDILDASLEKIVNTAIITTPDGDSHEAEGEIPVDGNGSSPFNASCKIVSDADGDGVAEPGERLGYDICVKNTSIHDVNNVHVQDELKGVLPYITNNPANVDVTIRYEDNHIETKKLSDLINGFTIDKVRALSEIHIMFFVDLKADLDTDVVKVIENRASINNSWVHAIIKTYGSFNFTNSTKTVRDSTGNSVAEPGERLSYVITVKNSGNLKADGVNIKDPLTELLPVIKETDLSSVRVEVVVDGVVKDSKTLQNLVDGFNMDIAAHSTVVLRFTVTLKDTLPASLDTIHNKATITDPDGVKTEVETSIAVVSSDFLDSCKSVDDAGDDSIAQPGEVVNYKIEVINSSANDHEDVAVKDTLSNVLPHVKETDLSAVTVRVHPVGFGSDYTITLQQLVNGTTVDVDAYMRVEMTFSLTVKDDLDTDVVTELRNKALIDNSIEVEAVIPTGDDGGDIGGEKEADDANHDGYANYGETVLYTITVSNTTDADAEDVLVKENTDLSSYIKEAPADVKVYVDGTDSGKSLADLTSDGIRVDVESGDSVKVTFTVTIKDELASTITVLENEAKVGDKTVSDSIRIGPKPGSDLTAEKTVEDGDGNDKAEDNENLKYKIIITNNSSSAAEDIVVKDPLTQVKDYITNVPADTTVKVGDTGVSANLSQLMGDGITVDVPANSSLTIEFTVRLKGDVTSSDLDTLKNTATVNNVEVEAEIEVGEPKAPNIQVTKTVADAGGNGKVHPGEQFTYTITITNTGSASATGANIKDTLSGVLPNVTETDYSTVVLTMGSDTSKNLQNLIDGFDKDIAVGDIITIRFTLTLKSDVDVSAVTKLDNTVTVGGKNASASIPTEAGPHSDFSDSSKAVSDASGDDLAAPNENLTYTITVRNSGNADATGVIVKEITDLSPYFTSDSGSAKVYIDDVDSGKTLSDLYNGISIDVAKNSSKVLKFTVTVKSDLDLSTVRKIDNEVKINDLSRTATINTIAMATDFTVTKSVTDSDGDNIAKSGDTLNYVITITNANGDTGVVIRDTLEELIPYIQSDLTAISVTYTSNGVTTTKTLNDLKNGIHDILVRNSTITIRFSVVLGTINPSTVSSLENTVTVNSKSADASIPTGASDLSNSTKTGVDANRNNMVTPGEQFSFTITVRNSGSVVATGVSIKEDISQFSGIIKEDPASVMVRVDGANSSITLQDMINGITADIPANGSKVYNFTLTAKDDFDPFTQTSIVNKVTINNLVRQATLTTGKLSVQIVKSYDAGSDDTISPGEAVTYTLLVHNYSTVTGEVTVTDTLENVKPYIKETDYSAVTVTASNGRTYTLQNLMDGIKFDMASMTDVTLRFTVTFKDDLPVDIIDRIPNRATVELVRKTGGIGTQSAANGGSTIGTQSASDDKVTDEHEVSIRTAAPNLNDSFKAVADANGNGVVDKGEVLTYTIVVKNTGLIPAYSVRVQDNFAQVLPYIKESASSVAISSDQGSYTLQNLIDGITIDVPAGGMRVFSFKVTAKDDLTSATVATLTNTVYINTIEKNAHIGVKDAPVTGSSAVEIPTVPGQNQGIEEPVGGESSASIPVTKPNNPSIVNAGVQSEMLPYVMAMGVALVAVLKRRKKS